MTQKEKPPTGWEELFDKQLVEYKWLEQSESLLRTVGEPIDYGKIVIVKKREEVSVESVKEFINQVVIPQVTKDFAERVDGTIKSAPAASLTLGRDVPRIHHMVDRDDLLKALSELLKEKK